MTGEDPDKPSGNDDLTLHSESSSEGQANLDDATLLPGTPSDSAEEATLPPSSATRAGNNDATIAPTNDISSSGTNGILGAGYEMLGELGRGGMGVVYKARDRDLNRTVALKMILAGVHASDDSIARFKTEAEAVAQLQHRGIVQVYDVGQIDGQPYCALEFVEGGALDELMAREELSINEAVAIVEELAHAMSSAHQAGIVHRDLKPANVLMSNATGESTTLEGGLGKYRPKVTDFGLAKRVEQDSQQTQTGAIMGTPSYMAPEQAKGVKRIGPAADIYSLGAILYHLVCGQTPFSGDSPLDVIMKVIDDPPTAPRTLNPKVDRDLDTIVLKCLEKEPAARYASAEHLAQDLRRYQLGMPIEARPVSSVERVGKWVRRKPWTASMIGLATLSVIGVIIGGAIFNSKLSRANDQIQIEHGNTIKALAAETKAREETDAARQRAEVSEAQSRRRLVDSYVNNALLASNNRESLDSLTWLSQAITLEQDPRRQRMHGLRYGLALQDSPKPVHTWLLDSPVFDCRFSTDGRRLAAHTRFNSHLNVWDLENGELVSDIRFPGFVTGFDTDGEFQRAVVVYADTSSGAPNASLVQMVNLATNQLIGSPMTFELDDTIVDRVSALTGRMVSLGEDQETVEVFDLRTSATVGSLSISEEVLQLKLHPNGRFVGVLLKDRLEIFDIETNTLLLKEPVADLGSNDRGFKFYGDEVGIADDRLRGFRISDGESTGTFPRIAHKQELRIAVHPQANGMAVGMSDGTLEIYDTGGNRIDKQKLASEIVDIQFNSKGDRLFVATPYEVLRIDPATGESADASIPAIMLPLLSFDVSADDHKIVISSGTGVFEGDCCVRTWNLDDTSAGGELFGGDQASVSDLSVSRDGNRLVVYSTDRKRVAVMDIEDRENPQRIQRLPTDANDKGVRIRFASWDHAGESLALAFEDGRLQFVGAATGNLIAEAMVQDPQVGAFCEDKWFTVVHGEGEKLASVVRVADASFVCKDLSHRRKVIASTISTDGEFLITASADLSLRRFELATGKEVQKQNAKMGLKSADFFPNRNAVLLAGFRLGKKPGRVRFFDTETLTPLMEDVDFDSMVETIRVSPDGTLVAVGTENGETVVRRASDGSAYGSLMSHPQKVEQIGFSDDNQILLTVCDDQHIRLFETESGIPIGRPIFAGSKIRSAGFLGSTYDVLIDADRCRIVSFAEPQSEKDVAERARFLTGKAISGRGELIYVSADALNVD